jgi:NADPH:quinone reductase-like Zn-dependent oxidoreductase
VKAAVIRETGPPQVLSIENVEEPSLQLDEVRIRVESVSVNQTLDLQIRSGATKRGVTLPHVLGVDPAGTITEVGSSVTGLGIGDRVVVASAMWCNTCDACRRGEHEDCGATRHIGVHRWGGYAESVAVPAANVYVIADDLEFAAASVIIRHAPTAWNLLQTKVGLQAGETVLVMGASGGLGSTGVQLAKLAGASVIAGAGSSARVDVATKLGADHGIAYRETSLAEGVANATDGRGVDVVFDNVGDPTLWPDVVASMARGARYVTAGAHAGGQVELDLHRLYRQRLRFIGGAGHRPSDIQHALELAADGRLSANISARMPLSQAVEAHKMAELRLTTGKIVLQPQELGDTTLTKELT